MDAQLAFWLIVVCGTTFIAVLCTATSSRELIDFARHRALVARLPVPQILVRIAAHQAWRERCDACNREIPEMLDVLVLGLSAGLSFDMSLGLYSTYFKNELAHLMRLAMMSWQLGMQTRSEALQALAKELGSPAFKSFVVAVEEALVFGSPLAAVLTRQAELCREQQRSLVEEQIEKAPVKMLIPLGTLIVPAMLLSILGPLLVAATQTL